MGGGGERGNMENQKSNNLIASEFFDTLPSTLVEIDILCIDVSDRYNLQKY